MQARLDAGFEDVALHCKVKALVVIEAGRHQLPDRYALLVGSRFLGLEGLCPLTEYHFEDMYAWSPAQHASTLMQGLHERGAT